MSSSRKRSSSASRRSRPGDDAPKVVVRAEPEPEPPPAEPEPEPAAQPPAEPDPPAEPESPVDPEQWHRWRNATGRLVEFRCADGTPASIRPGCGVSLSPDDTQTALGAGLTPLGPVLP